MSVILNEAVRSALGEAYKAYIRQDKKTFYYQLDVAAKGTDAIYNLGHDPAREREMEVMILDGEWLLVAAFDYIDRPKELLEQYRLAEKKLLASSRVLGPEMAYLPPSKDLFEYFHVPPEQADQNAELFSQAVGLYGRLTGGGGEGADFLYKAAIALHRGDTQRARTLAEQAQSVGGKWITAHTENLLRQIETEERK